VIINRENGFLVPPKNANELSDAMISLFNDEDLRARMSNSARKYAELHDWSNVAQKVESLYHEICQ
jgi:glycosyltransferase involved in cell wall biosynthesis